MTRPAYLVSDGDVLLPSATCQGPWGATISGHVVGGILARSLEQVGSGSELVPARLTVDLLRPTAIAPLHVRTTVRRDGRRIRLVDAELMQNDVVVSRASAVFLRRGEHPAGDIWSSPVAMPPLPADPGPLPEDLMMFVWGYGGDGGSTGAMAFAEWGDAAGPKYAWIRQVRPLVEGEVTSPFVTVAMAADAASATSHWGTGGLRYINADYTLTLVREPVGEYIGLAATSHTSQDGVAAGAATVFDAQGPIGNATTVGLANPVESFRPRA
ncbi:acyl-CoA thioesterase domain-containing protein [Mycolicibacterium vinylchloridicum]|uniref:acyl-CoA thioesterase domain-containing protein n=1 Tax=Mycolicibacterium vinylchloridicum TaxID=2736928 RepID=UPI0015C7866C|nr:thioesterase family protein [Mycolicibacterium vinylchloridicum]